MIVHTLESRREQWAPDLGNILGMVQISMIYSVHATHLLNSPRQDRGGRRATLSGNYQGFAVKTADSAPPGQGTMNLHSIADVGMAGAFTETLQLTKAVTMQSCGTGTLVHEGNHQHTHCSSAGACEAGHAPCCVAPVVKTQY